MPRSIRAPLPRRIEQLLQDLESIKGELQDLASDTQAERRAPQAPIGMINELKYSIDQMRLVLWAYQDSHAIGSISPEKRLQQIRTQVAADILRSLGSEFSNKGVPSTPEVKQLHKQLRTVGALLSAAT